MKKHFFLFLLALVSAMTPQVQPADSRSFTYDLMGRRMPSTQLPNGSTQLRKGLYIRNGRKLLVR